MRSLKSLVFSSKKWWSQTNHCVDLIQLINYLPTFPSCHHRLHKYFSRTEKRLLCLCRSHLSWLLYYVHKCCGISTAETAQVESQLNEDVRKTINFYASYLFLVLIRLLLFFFLIYSAAKPRTVCSRRECGEFPLHSPMSKCHPQEFPRRKGPALGRKDRWEFHDLGATVTANRCPKNSQEYQKKEFWTLLITSLEK